MQIKQLLQAGHCAEADSMNYDMMKTIIYLFYVKCNAFLVAFITSLNLKKPHVAPPLFRNDRTPANYARLLIGRFEQLIPLIGRLC